MNRRNFLKALGLGGSVTALQACGVNDNRYYTPVEQILPYVTRSEQTTPGTPTFFATAVGTGPRAWPVTAVHRDGRVVNVGANRPAPTAPAVPAVSLFDLQRHYSPDRIGAPRKGGQAVTWDAGLGDLAGAVKAARAAGKKVAWIGPYRSGSIVDLLNDFTGGNAVFWEPLGLDAEALAAKALFGADAGLPRYELAEARYVLSFGAAFLGDAWGHAGIRSDYTRARTADDGGFVTRFAAVTPHRDQTAANADDWYGCVPGTEAQVALAVAKLVAEVTHYDGPARGMLAGADPAAAASASGVPVAAIEAMAKAFAAGTAVALPGGVAGASSAATRLAAASYLLNVVSRSRGFRAGGYRAPVHAYGDIEALIADMDAGKVGVLLLDDTDPAQTLPGGERFVAAMGKVDLSVSVSSHGSETANAAKLVLPTADTFEDWGDEEPWAGFRILRQPAMNPLGDVRSLGDVLLATWRAVDAASAPTGNWRDWLKARWADRFFAPAPAAAPAGAPPAPVEPAWKTAAFKTWWTQVLSAGFYREDIGDQRLELVGSLDLAGAGEIAGSGDLHLQVFAHPYLLDGRYANEPWAQENPDPMTGQVWDSYVLIHPATAAKLGVADKDLVTITTAAGSVSVGVEVHPCLREDVIAVPMGGGHGATKGRYADGVGANVAKLLQARKDPSGALVWQGTKCSVAKAGGTSEIVSTYGGDTDMERKFAVVVDADAWAKQGDKETHHPGDLTGIHHLPMDARLTRNEDAWRAANPTAEPEKKVFTQFYPVPDHPTYRFAMTVDTNACTGCGACMVACSAENNLPVVGKTKVAQGREMTWIRVNRYFGEHSADETPSVHFVPMMCQQCGHAPCESVCPVLATYHTIDGLNAMVYNRCAGTRYCSNACPYSARKFNYHTYVWPEPFNLQLNPDVVTRTMGVMEKCTFCVQRIRRTKSAFRDKGFKNTVPDAELKQLTACAEACPSQAITFGNLVDPESTPAKSRKNGRTYMPIAEINTFPAVNYLARASYHVKTAHLGEAGHAAGGEHEAPAGAAHEGGDKHEQPASPAGGH